MPRAFTLAAAAATSPLVRLATLASLAVAVIGGAAASAALAAPPASSGAPRPPAGSWTEVQAPPQPYNLLLISLDTTRQDRLSCYGFTKATTPNLDKLAADGILFQDAYTPVPVTLPAHATMLTGLYPFEHGARNNGSYVVPPETVTLPELLKKKGYATGAVLGAFPLENRFGLNQGFDFYDDHFPSESIYREVDMAQRNASDVTRLSLEWLDKPKSGPFFLWSHYYDAHAPYRPPDAYKAKFPGDSYAGEIAYMDAEIGTLLDGLRSRGLLERTVIVVAGDHGEGLDEHNEHTHAMFIYGTTERVPLLLRLPAAGAFAGREWRGVRVPGLVNLIDILPTAWNSLGLPRAELPPNSGMSLLPVATRTAPAHPWLYHETLVPDLEYGASDLRGYQNSRWKYIRAPKPELYDLEKDPKELKNLVSKEGERVRAMKSSLDSLLRADAGAKAPAAMDAETIEKLRSLGYVAGSTAPAASTNKPDPKDMNWVVNAVVDAGTLAAEYKTSAALQKIDSVLAAYPKTPMAQHLRGTYLTRLGRGSDAVKAFDQALKDCGDCAEAPRLVQERIAALLASGRAEEALKATRAMLKSDPKRQGLNLTEGEILEAKGDVEGARLAYAREAEYYPREPLPPVKLGMLAASHGKPVDAEKAYRKALEVNPRNPDALVMLAELLDATGRKAEAATMTDRAIAADPSHPGVLLRKAFTLQQQGKTVEALAAYQACLERRPGNPVTLFNMGALYAQMGRDDEAERSYQAAIATGSAPVGAYANLGVVMAKKGNLTEAVKLWEEALRRDPNGPGASAIQNNLRQARGMMQGGSGQK